MCSSWVVAVRPSEAISPIPFMPPHNVLHFNKIPCKLNKVVYPPATPLHCDICYFILGPNSPKLMNELQATFSQGKLRERDLKINPGSQNMSIFL